MTRPTKTQLAVWEEYFYHRLPQAEAMRRLKMKHKAGFHWTMVQVTKHVLKQNLPLL